MQTTICTKHVPWEELAELAGWDPNGLAGHLGISLRQLERQFHRQFDARPQAWLKRQKLAAGSRMLLEGKMVRVVAAALGYDHCANFCRDFKQHWGLTALQFVATHRVEAALTTLSRSNL